jgi:ATP-dependent RNA helicase DeaD
MEIAMGAEKLAHLAGAGDTDDDADIPLATPAASSPLRSRDQARAPRSSEKGPRARARSDGMTRIYIGAGRKNNLRPADLVGAIANEAQIDASTIGTIEISDRYALVEVPKDLAEVVIKALRAGTIKGKKLTVRRDMATSR